MPRFAIATFLLVLVLVRKKGRYMGPVKLSAPAWVRPKQRRTGVGGRELNEAKPIGILGHRDTDILPSCLLFPVVQSYRVSSHLLLTLLPRHI